MCTNTTYSNFTYSAFGSLRYTLAKTLENDTSFLYEWIRLPGQPLSLQVHKSGLFAILMSFTENSILYSLHRYSLVSLFEPSVSVELPTYIGDVITTVSDSIIGISSSNGTMLFDTYTLKVVGTLPDPLEVWNSYCEPKSISRYRFKIDFEYHYRIVRYDNILLIWIPQPENNAIQFIKANYTDRGVITIIGGAWTRVDNLEIAGRTIVMKVMNNDHVFWATGSCTFVSIF